MFFLCITSVTTSSIGNNRGDKDDGISADEYVDEGCFVGDYNKPISQRQKEKIGYMTRIIKSQKHNRRLATTMSLMAVANFRSRPKNQVTKAQSEATMALLCGDERWRDC